MPCEQVSARRGDKTLAENSTDALNTASTAGHVPGQELQDPNDVRRILSREFRRHSPTDEDPQGSLDVERSEDATLLVVEPLLLKKREQTGYEVPLHVILLCVLIEIQDPVVFAKAVSAEITVQVVAQRAPGIDFGESGVVLHRLSESG
ncbi:MAG: hypothetical protein OXD35_10110 [Thiotrichales bacterium]|nr:hypothetical protein [Thiotrichales bacterium]